MQDHIDLVRPQQVAHRNIRFRQVKAHERRKLLQLRHVHAEGRKQLEIQLRFVQVAFLAAEVDALVARAPVPQPVTGANAQRNARLLGPMRYFTLGKHMDDRIRAQLFQLIRRVHSSRLQILQSDDAIHVRALPPKWFGVTFHQSDDPRAGRAFLDRARHGQGEHGIAQIVRAAQDDGARKLHARSRQSCFNFAYFKKVACALIRAITKPW
jgi:hypothetical protein